MANQKHIIKKIINFLRKTQNKKEKSKDLITYLRHLLQFYGQDKDETNEHIFTYLEQYLAIKHELAK